MGLVYDMSEASQKEALVGMLVGTLLEGRKYVSIYYHSLPAYIAVTTAVGKYSINYSVHPLCHAGPVKQSLGTLSFFKQENLERFLMGTYCMINASQNLTSAIEGLWIRLLLVTIGCVGAYCSISSPFFLNEYIHCCKMVLYKVSYRAVLWCC